MNKLLSKKWLIAILLLLGQVAQSQRYLSDIDSSLFIRDTVRPLVKLFENLRFSGYIQSQYQQIDTEGAKTFGGGDFSEHSKSRFMLRRARLKVDYLALTQDRLPKALFTFQIDATERTVRVRDMFLRVYETRGNNFSLTTGIFSKPFGYEVNLSSSYRETPERGRMSQTLIPSERGLGVMVSYEPFRKEARNKFVKADIGLFNGPGLSATTDFDNHKDIIGRITLKPVRMRNLAISGGLSYMNGGWEQITKYVYRVGKNPSGDYVFKADSSESNLGKIAPRDYYGADLQFIIDHGWGHTELRGEFWTGKQPGSAATTGNPGSLPTGDTYIRDFNGAFFYFLQDIVNTKNQLLLKYDWYDPNTHVRKEMIGQAGTNFTPGDIRYATLGFGFSRLIKDHVKLVLYYEIVKNEKTNLPGYQDDLKDNLFTCRLQFRF